MTGTSTALRPLLDAVATALGDGWSATASASGWSNAVDLTGPDARRIRGHVDTWRCAAAQRLHLDPVYPDDLFGLHLYGLDRGHITVAPNKAAEKIAGDIQRRLLPVYDATLASAWARKASRDADIAAANSLVEAIRTNLGETATSGGISAAADHGGERHGWARLGEYSSPANARVEVPRGDYAVTFTVRVRRDLAPALAAAIAQLTP